MDSPARPGCLLLDLDGTLLDTAPDMAAALNHILAEEDLAPLPLATMAWAVTVSFCVSMAFLRCWYARPAIAKQSCSPVRIAGQSVLEPGCARIAKFQSGPGRVPVA